MFNISQIIMLTAVIAYYKHVINAMALFSIAVLLYTTITNPNKKKIEAPIDIPPAVPSLQRTLSHENQADESASYFFDRCQEGETILSNFFHSNNGYIVFSFFRRENGEMVKHTLTEQKNIFDIQKWTYTSTLYTP